MVVDKPDWSQASYQEMNDLVIRQGARIAELELTLGDFMDANDFKDKKLTEMRRRIAELEGENAGLKARWADMCAGMRKIELLEKGGAK